MAAMMTRRNFIKTGTAITAVGSSNVFFGMQKNCDMAFAADLQDRCWMQGCDSLQFDGPAGRFRIPLSAAIPIAEACAYMGVMNVRIETNSYFAEGACKRTEQLKRVLRENEFRTHFEVIAPSVKPGDNGSALRMEIMRQRHLLTSTKPILFGIGLWDFIGAAPLGVDNMRMQLNCALELFVKGEVQGFVFRSTPLVNKGLPEVEMCREWIAQNAAVKMGSMLG